MFWNAGGRSAPRHLTPFRNTRRIARTKSDEAGNDRRRAPYLIRTTPLTSNFHPAERTEAPWSIPLYARNEIM
ncbi:MAG: hypothetical protein BJ554DRAFT_1216 [Olpidium bornovanus]|uniref:Uncharacterized protein n=1 Tax=Olpidium bornovanus TaxID=278681 RepID=A0A8H7ZSU2_9FUNG|nr:MAG: hypothetical protein BJ554DRAFT_1216 [Olpidium bornovanus]